MTNSTNATETTSWSTLPAILDIVYLALNIFLSITATVGNALVLIALYKVSSIYPPTKWLFGCLAITDLCVGLTSQPLYTIYILRRNVFNEDDIKTFFYVREFVFLVLFIVSVLTSTTISVDRLLALSLRQRYRHVVTLRRVRVVIGCVWSLAVLYDALYTAAQIFFLDINTIKSFICTTVGLIIISIVISTFCYIKIFVALRHQQAQLEDHVQPGQLNGGRNSLNIARYKKTVWSIAWVQLTLLTCFAPYVIFVLIWLYGNIADFFLTVDDIVDTNRFSISLLYLNSSLNPILYCWRIRDVRQEVKNILRKCAPC